MNLLSGMEKPDTTQSEVCASWVRVTTLRNDHANESTAIFTRYVSYKRAFGPFAHWDSRYKPCVRTSENERKDVLDPGPAFAFSHATMLLDCLKRQRLHDRSTFQQ